MKRQKSKRTALVYSTDQGRVCPDCGVVKADCRCRLVKISSSSSGDGTVRLRRETKGRGGKAVTVVSGLPNDGEELRRLAKLMKQKCGVGGAVKGADVEIQGDQRAVLKDFLEQQGFKTKLAGG
ncbi:MAG: stress response translation initiation inhibitor YciH [Pseudomonadota bacterium]